MSRLLFTLTVSNAMRHTCVRMTGFGQCVELLHNDVRSVYSRRTNAVACRVHKTNLLHTAMCEPPRADEERSIRRFEEHRDRLEA